jgi:formylmethanofuran--tetrahydromethanopterin N-formyltransferase
MSDEIKAEQTDDSQTRNGVRILNTFAEAFSMRAARVVITAQSPEWARTAALSLTGFATSVIGCKVEAGIEAEIAPSETPDLRPGISVLLFGFDAEGLQRQLIDRIGQTVLTCPTTACFDGLPDASDRVTVGGQLRHFGDKFQSSKVLGGQRYWRIPVMEGEFLVQETFGVQRAIGGGNLLILASDQRAGLAAAEAAVQAMRTVRGIILPFPGGIVRAGSKVGAKKYKNMVASTNDAYCPTLRGREGVVTQIPDGANSVLEIVADGLDRPALEQALSAGLTAACIPGVVEISAGNYGGKLGKHHFHLHQLLGVRS